MYRGVLLTAKVQASTHSLFHFISFHFISFYFILFCQILNLQLAFITKPPTATPHPPSTESATEGGELVRTSSTPVKRAVEGGEITRTYSDTGAVAAGAKGTPAKLKVGVQFDMGHHNPHHPHQTCQHYFYHYHELTNSPIY